MNTKPRIKMFQFDKENDYYFSQLSVWANGVECHVRHRLERKELDAVCQVGYEALQGFMKSRQRALLDEMGVYIASVVEKDLLDRNLIEDD